MELAHDKITGCESAKIISVTNYIQDRNSSIHISLKKIIGRNKLLVLPHRSRWICNSLFIELFILRIEIYLNAL